MPDAPQTTDPDGRLGHPQVRIDGRAKVTGATRYASDIALPGVAHAALVTSPIVRGRILGFDLDAARAMPGLLGIFTHRDFADAIRPVAHLMAGGYANTSHRPLGSDRIAYAGQIVALVVAETSEAAHAAAGVVRVRYAPEPFAGGFDEPGAEAVRLADLKSDHADPRVGDDAAGFAAGPCGSRPATRRRSSITIRWSCSPPPAPGRAGA